MSAAPRPYSMPSRIVGSNGGLNHVLHRAGGHHIGVSGKHHDGAGRAAPRPEIVHVAEAHPLDPEAELFQAFDEDVLAARVIGRERAAGDQGFGELQGIRT